MKNLVRLLTLLALLVAPLGMLGDHAAMAAAPSVQATASSEQDTASSGHCAEAVASHDQSPDERAPAKSLECMMDCMMLCSGMPAMALQLAEPLPPQSMAAAVSLSPLVRGLTPQAEPRPPQLS